MTSAPPASPACNSNVRARERVRDRERDRKTEKDKQQKVLIQKRLDLIYGYTFLNLNFYLS